MFYDAMYVDTVTSFIQSFAISFGDEWESLVRQEEYCKGRADSRLAHDAANQLRESQRSFAAISLMIMPWSVIGPLGDDPATKIYQRTVSIYEVAPYQHIISVKTCNPVLPIKRQDGIKTIVLALRPMSFGIMMRRGFGRVVCDRLYLYEGPNDASVT